MANKGMNDPGVEYRPIAGFFGYFAGSDGSIWSKRICGKNKGRLAQNACRLSVYRRPYGAHYCMVCFRAQPGKRVSCHYVHRLVLQAFAGPCPDGMVACHNDGDTTNNRIENLRWDTMQGNHADKWAHGTAEFGESHHSAKLTTQAVRTIRHMSQMGVPSNDTAEVFGLRRDYVNTIARGEAWAMVSSPLLPKELSHC